MAWSGGSIGTCDDAFRSGAGAARRAGPKGILFVVSNPAIAASNAMPMGF